MTPIFQTSTYVQPAVAEPLLGYDYARVSNPTREALERNVAALEGGPPRNRVRLGPGRDRAVIKRLSTGDHVVSEENTYGGTTRMFTRVLAKLGIEFSFVDTSDPDAVRAAVRPSTRIVHVETPTNPMMRLCDLGRHARHRARGRRPPHGGQHVRLALQPAAARPRRRCRHALDDQVPERPLRHHRRHLVVNDDALAEEIRFVRKSSGAVPGRWTPGSASAEPRPCTCAWSGTTRTG
jgi:hypothetical protein